MAFSRSRKLANIGKAIDSSATNDFLGLDDSGGLFKDVAYSNVLGSPTILDSSALTSLVDAAYVQARQTDVGIDSAAIINLIDSSYVSGKVPPGSLGIDSAATINLIDSSYVSGKITAGLDSAGVTGIVDSDYVSSKTGASSGFSYYCYIASDGQTDFTGADKFNNTLSYSSSADNILVFYNGVLQIKTFDYTTSGGDTVTLTTGADSGVPVTIAEFAISSSGSSGSSFSWGGDRGLVAGGGSTGSNVIQYYDITSTGNATDFGDLTLSRTRLGGLSSGTRAVIGGGFNGSTSYYNTMDYVTTATTGNAQDFGDLSQSRSSLAGISDGTTGVFAGGALQGTSFQLDTIDSFAIASTGNASDFGNLTVGRSLIAGWNNATRGVFAGGDPAGASNSNVMDYITIASAGNATDFGDMTDSWNRAAGAGDATYALFAGGRRAGSSELNGWTENIDYVTVATTGNASDFGDLTRFKDNCAGNANGTRATFSGGSTNTGSNVTLNVIDYVTVATPGNAADFGDLLATTESATGTSGTAA